MIRHGPTEYSSSSTRARPASMHIEAHSPLLHSFCVGWNHICPLWCHLAMISGSQAGVTSVQGGEPEAEQSCGAKGCREDLFTSNLNWLMFSSGVQSQPKRHWLFYASMNQGRDTFFSQWQVTSIFLPSL